MRTTVEYAPDRFIDVYGEPADLTLLLWHGRGPDERDVLATLAAQVAGQGIKVLVPDWDSCAPDGGRADLLRSVRFARVGEPQLLVAGWALGGTAAASLALNARRLGLGSVPAFCLAGDFQAIDPLSGSPFPTLTVPVRHQGSIQLLHGVDDDVIDIAGSRDFAKVLGSAGWEAELTELATDHTGIVGDMEAGRAAAVVIVETALRRPWADPRPPDR